MKKLLIATTNKGKLAEIKYFLQDLPIELLGLEELGINEKVEETGKTYQENAKIKALFYSHKTGLPSLADDGGLEIECLGGKPGKKSKRWIGGEETSDEELINYTLKKLKGVPLSKRKACLVVVCALAFPNGDIFYSEGEVCGVIAQKPFKKRTKGFPYRSLLYLPQIKKFYHQDDLIEEENKKYNHRGKALHKLKRILKEKVLK